MHKFTLQLALQLLILITQKSDTFCAKAEDVAYPTTKCECSPQLQTPPPPMPSLAPPPPRFVYVTELSPPPPQLPIGNLYGSNPFDWQIYSCSLCITHEIYEMSYSDYNSLSGNEMEPFCEREEECMNFVHGNLKVLEIGGYKGLRGQEELVLAFIKIGPSIERVIIDTQTNYSDLDVYRDLRRIKFLGYAFCGRRSEGDRTEAKERAKRLASRIPELIELVIT